MNKFDLTIYQLIAREIDIKKIEQWVYAEKKLEEALSADEYLEIISLNYNTSSSFYEAEKILKHHIDLGRYYEWALRKILQKIIDRPFDVHIYIEQCYDMYCDGYSFLENLGLGYGLWISCPPTNYSTNTWEELKSVEKRNLMNSFYPAVADEAQKVLLWLDSKKILLTGHEGGYQGITYKDNRTPEEEVPAAYETASKTKKWWKFW